MHIGRETSFDDEIAARHFDTACEHGHYESCKSLGLMYLKGKGVDRDRAKANELLDRFRLNASIKYLRLGVQAGLPSIAGGEGELILPIPVGPAIGLSGSYSFIPGGGSLLVVLEGKDEPSPAPDAAIMGATARVYPNHQARGAYLAGGWNQFLTNGAAPRQGFSFRMGMRNDAKYLYSGIEFGMGLFGVVNTKDFDPDATPYNIPLLLPTLAISVGLTPF